MKFQCRYKSRVISLEVLGFVRKPEKIIENSKEDPEASVESIIKKSFKKLIKSN
jgi:hypothetical protein